ncbi:hypothetical protein ACIGKQ_22245 [Gordonia sp. NPDC062954]|uniref:hypothetical protein n=1 Tax=Gordonia sp. NPDC062954 TaxID=3364003 RepID=UPI0037C58693
MAEWIVLACFATVLVGTISLALAGGTRDRWLERYYVPWVSTAAISVLGTVAIALVGLVVEDWLPAPPPDTSTWQVRASTNWMRVSIAAGTLVVLVLAIIGRTLRERRTGTLYYVRLQPAGQTDWHTASVRRASNSLMDYRSASASYDLGGEGAIDARKQVERVSVELERAANDDRPDSGSKFAPNIVAPAALALGYDWLAPPKSTLLDLNHPAVEDKPGSGDFEFSVERDSPFSVQQLAGALVLEDRRFDNSLPGGIGILDIHLTNRQPTDQPHFEVDFLRTVGLANPQGAVGAAMVEPQSRAFCPAVDGQPNIERGVDLQLACAAAAYQIRRALTDFPNTVIILQLSVPKTFSFGIGWYLANDPLPDEMASAVSPWRRIVPVAYVRRTGAIPVFRPMWVRWDQEDPSALLRNV